jgi:pyruvate dehydrogenase E2 component (dihydrolipoamide acetyltransferase)
VLASPAARKLAAEKGIDLSQVKGTGLDGVIVRADIEEFQAPEPSKAAPSEPSAPTAATAPGAAAPLESGDYTDIPHSQIRKITASRLLQSKQTIPHYYLSTDVRVDKLLELRAKLNKAQEASGGKKISLNDFVIKASALALKKVPAANSSWTEEYIRQYKNIDISVAVQTDNGLMVPVVKDADKKGLGTISENVKVLAEKARANKLSPAEFQGGTFTISNLGMYGIKQFCAIINPPQAAILAVGTTEKRVLPPGPGEETYGNGTYMTVTLSCDHRIIDGAMGAEWMGAFKSYVEDPITMIL